MALTDEQAKALQGEVTKESMDRADVIFKQIKATEKEMEDKIREEKGLEADFVMTAIIKELNGCC